MLRAVPYRYRVLVLLCSLTTLTYLDRICISIVGVRIKSEFHLDNEQFGWGNQESHTVDNDILILIWFQQFFPFKDCCSKKVRILSYYFNHDHKTQRLVLGIVG